MPADMPADMPATRSLLACSWRSRRRENRNAGGGVVVGMSDKMRKRMAAVVLGLSLVGGTSMMATASLTSAWSEGNNQPPRDYGLVAGANETHTGNLTALP
jgi:hypothetical protein